MQNVMVSSEHMCINKFMLYVQSILSDGNFML